MKIFSLLIITIMLLSVSVRADTPAMENQLDVENLERLTELKTVPSGDLYDSIINEIEREDRMDRCTARLEREYPRTTLLSRQNICKRIFYNYDQQNQARETLRERFDLSSEQAERLSKLREENRLRLESLTQDQLEKLSELEVKNLEKVSQLRKDQLERLSELDDSKLELFSRLSRAEVKDLAEKNMEEIQERLRTARAERISPDDAGNRRTISDDRIKKARAAFSTAKERYESAKENYLEARREFSRLVEEEREACQEADSEACDDAREASIEKAKEYLNDLAVQQFAYIEQFRERVRSSESLSSNEVTDIEEELDELEAKIQRSLDFLETANTKDEVKEAGKSLTNSWKRIEIKLMDRREQIVYRIGKQYVSRSEALEAKMDRMLVAMEDKSIDTTPYDSEVEKFSELVAEANDKLDEGRELFEEFRESDNPSDNLETLENAKEKFSEAHNLLVEANDLFKDLVEQIWEETEEDFEEEEDEVDIIVIDDPSLPKPPSLEDIEVKA